MSTASTSTIASTLFAAMSLPLRAMGDCTNEDLCGLVSLPKARAEDEGGCIEMSLPD